jgi:hypothetical protein
MPRYFFHLRDGDDRLLDVDGVELPDPASAAAQALKEARGMLGEEVRSNGRLQLNLRIDVEDEHGNIIHSLAFDQAVSIIREEGESGPNPRPTNVGMD